MNEYTSWKYSGNDAREARERGYQYCKYCSSVIYFNDRADNPEIANTKACNALGDASSKEKLCSNFKVADRSKYVVEVDGKGFRVGDLSALLLHKIWETAQLTFDDMNLKSAVITVPAAFDFDACQETYNAALMAGIETVTLIDEPTAAYQYYSHVQDLSDAKIIVTVKFVVGNGKRKYPNTMEKTLDLGICMKNGLISKA